MIHKDFVSKKKDKPTFTIAHQSFTARARLSFQDLMKLAGLRTKFSTLMDNPDVTQEQVTEVFTDIFNMVLVRGDRVRFLNLLTQDVEDDDDGENTADAELLLEAMTWLLDYYMVDEEGKEEAPESAPTSSSQEIIPISSKVVSFSRGTVEMTGTG